MWAVKLGGVTNCRCGRYDNTFTQVVIVVAATVMLLNLNYLSSGLLMVNYLRSNLLMVNLNYLRLSSSIFMTSCSHFKVWSFCVLVYLTKKLFHTSNPYKQHTSIKANEFELFDIATIRGTQ